jgi:protein involved in polysaccharide export with SLBB domain
MKKLLFIILSIISLSFSLEITSRMVDSAKSQYGISDAQIGQIAQQYSNNEDSTVTENFFYQEKKVTVAVVPVTDDKKEKNDLLDPYVSAMFPSELSQFGYDVFNQVSKTFTPLRNIPVAKDYVLGPGDELKIYLWGNIQQNFSVVVDALGNIDLPKVGRMTVSNLSLARASNLIETELGKHFANFTLEVTMGQLKTISVFVLGAAKTPGKYNVDSLSSVLHVLYASGGPSNKGSLRNIRLIRDSRTYRIIDLYDLLLYGDNSSDILLKSGDIIFVPNIGSVAAIKGAVKTPAIFEIQDNTNLYDLTRMAGEYTRNSYIKEINIVRKNIDNGRFELKTVSFPSLNDFKASSKRIDINDGDLVEIISLSDELRDWIEVKGEVVRPGRYSKGKAKNLSQLLGVAGGVTEKAYQDRANIYRITTNNQYMIMGVPLIGNDLEKILLHEFDKVVIYSNEERHQNYQVRINGEVVKPITQDYFEGITIRDLLFLANGYTPFADKTNIQILRRLTLEENKVIELKGITDSVLDAKLEAFDEVYIRKSAQYEYYGAVSLRGKVMNPGTYPLYKNETFIQLIDRAGGVRPDAFVAGIKFYRNLEDDLSQETSQMVDSQQSSIKLVSELADVNRLKVNFQELLNRKDDKEYLDQNNVILRDGDIIDVPVIPQEIRVIGGVYNVGSFMFKENYSMGHYLDNAGNFRKDADQGEVYVVKADGTVKKTTDSGYKISRGDTIVVPTRKFEEINYLKLILDWTQVVFNIATTWVLLGR